MPDYYDIGFNPDYGLEDLGFQPEPESDDLSDLGFQPEPQSWGDWGVGQLLRTGPAVAGTVAGGLIGGASSFGLGAPVGAAAGGMAGSALGETLGQWWEGEGYNPQLIAAEGLIGAIPNLGGKIPGVGQGLRAIGKYALGGAAEGGLQGLVGTFPRHWAQEGTLTDMSQWSMPSAREFAGNTAGGLAFGGLTAGGLAGGNVIRQNFRNPLPAPPMTSGNNYYGIGAGDRFFGFEVPPPGLQKIGASEGYAGHTQLLDAEGNPLTPPPTDIVPTGPIEPNRGSQRQIDITPIPGSRVPFTPDGRFPPVDPDLLQAFINSVNRADVPPVKTGEILEPEPVRREPDLTAEEVERIKEFYRQQIRASYGEDIVEGQRAADELDNTISTISKEAEEYSNQVRQAHAEGYNVYPETYKGPRTGRAVRAFYDETGKRYFVVDDRNTQVRFDETTSAPAQESGLFSRLLSDESGTLDISAIRRAFIERYGRHPSETEMQQEIFRARSEEPPAIGPKGMVAPFTPPTTDTPWVTTEGPPSGDIGPSLNTELHPDDLQRAREDRLGIPHTGDIVGGRELGAPPVPDNVLQAVRTLGNFGFDSPDQALQRIRSNPNWMEEWGFREESDFSRRRAAQIIENHVRPPVSIDQLTPSRTGLEYPPPRGVSRWEDNPYEETIGDMLEGAPVGPHVPNPLTPPVPPLRSGEQQPLPLGPHRPEYEQPWRDTGDTPVVDNRYAETQQPLPLESQIPTTHPIYTNALERLREDQALRAEARSYGIDEHLIKDRKEIERALAYARKVHAENTYPEGEPEQQFLPPEAEPFGGYIRENEELGPPQPHDYATDAQVREKDIDKLTELKTEAIHQENLGNKNKAATLRRQIKRLKERYRLHEEPITREEEQLGWARHREEIGDVEGAAENRARAARMALTDPEIGQGEFPFMGRRVDEALRPTAEQIQRMEGVPRRDLVRSLDYDWGRAQLMDIPPGQPGLEIIKETNPRTGNETTEYVYRSADGQRAVAAARTVTGPDGTATTENLVHNEQAGALGARAAFQIMERLKEEGAIIPSGLYSTFTKKLLESGKRLGKRLIEEEEGAFTPVDMWQNLRRMFSPEEGGGGTAPERKRLTPEEPTTRQPSAEPERVPSVDELFENFQRYRHGEGGTIEPVPARGPESLEDLFGPSRSEVPAPPITTETGQGILPLRHPKYNRLLNEQDLEPPTHTWRMPTDVERREKGVRRVAELQEQARQFERAGLSVNAAEARAAAERETHYLGGGPIKRSEDFAAEAWLKEKAGDHEGAAAKQRQADHAALNEAGQLELQWRRNRLLDFLNLSPEQIAEIKGWQADPDEHSPSLGRSYAQHVLRDVPDGPPGIDIVDKTPYSRDYKRYEITFRSPSGKPVGHARATWNADPDAPTGGRGSVGSFAADEKNGLYGRAVLHIGKELAKLNALRPSGSYSSYTKNILRRLLDMVLSEGAGERGSVPIGDMFQAFGEGWDRIKKVAGWGQGRQGPATQQAQYNWIDGLFALPKAITTSFDLSAPGRQGLALVNTPQFWKALSAMFGGLTESGFQRIDAELRNKPLFQPTGRNARTGRPESFADAVGLHLNDPSNPHGVGTRGQEIAQNWLGKAPLGPISAWYRMSNRGYATFLNHLRANRFEYLMNRGQDMSVNALSSGSVRENIFKRKIDTMEAMNLDPYRNLNRAREIADAVNTFTGQAPLRAHLLPLRNMEANFEGGARILGRMFFSPGLAASRFRLTWPPTYMMATPAMRKEYLKAAFGMAAGWTAAALLVKNAADAFGVDNEISLNPLSADFGKVRIGNFRVDPGGGVQQFLVLYSRLLAGKYTSSATGITHETGVGYQATTRGELAQRFAANKLEPSAKLAYDMAFASGYQPTQVGDRILQMYVPLIIQDMVELSNEKPELLPAAALSFFGMGTQIYGDKGQQEGKFISPENDWMFAGGASWGADRTSNDARMMGRPVSGRPTTSGMVSGRPSSGRVSGRP